MKLIYRRTLVFILLLPISNNPIKCSTINDDIFTNLADKIGNKLWELGSNLTKHAELNSEFNHANVTEINHDSIIAEMTNRIHTMLERKKNTLHRIVHTMEERSKNMPDYPTEKERLEYKYRDAKNLKAEDKHKLSKDVNFFNEHVTTDFSTVHVPADVYDRSNITILGIKYSEELDALFQHNYATDPTLSWQYFAGATGYMRVYPGIEWKLDDEQEVIFDARIRPWYIEAATDPKDVIILVDNSGSMMGYKSKIARHTVNSILETLGPNDFVNIYQFQDETVPVTDCFKSSLVQANLATIRELKFGIEKMNKANNLANFREALTKAFETLTHHRKEHLASMCNQAIMLVTDGIPDNFADILQKYNWRNVTEPPFPIRIFSFLIGREGSEVRETKWIACANQGYFVQLNTIPEVKEQVFNYMNVLARPLVLKNSKKIAWTSLYAHRIDPKITDFKWEQLQDEQQRQYTISYRENWKNFLNVSSQRQRDERMQILMREQNKYSNEVEGFNFVISMSHPAYDQRTKRNITENILINEAYWTQRVYEAEIAALLGVAGTDIPVTEFKKIMKPYYLGVNNYGFIVNNNGYIIVHPDHRPFFKGTLKPGYNSVDMLEVELLDTGDLSKQPRDFDVQVIFNPVRGEPSYILSNLSLLRDLVINQTDNAMQSFQVKYHYDNMKRVSTGRRNYHIKKIPDSPLTLVLAVMKPPCNNSDCLAVRISAPNPERKTFVGADKVKELFSGDWRIHPEWLYCKHNYNNELHKGYAGEDISKKSLELVYFLKKMVDDAFWDESRDPYTDVFDDRKTHSYEKKHPYTGDKNTKKDASIPILTYFCDQELIRNVIFDANVTKNMFKHLENGFNPPTEFSFGEQSIQNVFIATHSGLTRWKNLSGKIQSNSFMEKNDRSIDEIWYRRAVEQNYINKESFVFSTPLEEAYSPELLVTASHAIFVKKKKSEDAVQAPAAVVGFQLLHKDFDAFVKSITNNASKSNSRESTSYYVIDNNGYIITANNTDYIGKFFGAVHPDIMRSFINCRIFRKIIIFDYQGVCFLDKPASNAAYPTITKPVDQMNQLIKWTVGTFFTGIIRINFELLMYGLVVPFEADVTVSDDDDEEVIQEYESFQDDLDKEEPYKPKYSKVKHIVVLNRTEPMTCDRKVNLYSLEMEKTWGRRQNCTNVTNIIRIIPHTNLLLVIIPQKTEHVKKRSILTTEPKRIQTNGFSSPVCYKVNAVLSRRRPSSCCKDDLRERKIELCGGSSNTLEIGLVTWISSLLVCLSILITY